MHCVVTHTLSHFCVICYRSPAPYGPFVVVVKVYAWPKLLQETSGDVDRCALPIGRFCDSEESISLFLFFLREKKVEQEEIVLGARFHVVFTTGAAVSLHSCHINTLCC